MTDTQQLDGRSSTAKVQARGPISLVWIVPLVALVVGGWLAFKAISEKGPTVTITFRTAESLEAGKTKIKYKDVEIGQIGKIVLSKDTSHVIVTAKLVKGAEQYLTDQTRFWVVRARVQGGSVSGLGTLLSGAYIGVDPSQAGNPTESYTGLEVPPVLTLGQPGRHFTLEAEALGSLDIGAPVYYRQIKVGQVVSYGYDQNDQGVNIGIFIQAPHHKRVTKNTRFWNASGIDLSLNADGLKIDTQSMVSIASGGIAFDLPKDALPGQEAEDDKIFHLYSDRGSIHEKSYSIRTHWLLLFEQSVRGLNIGAPVELYGIKVGEVIDLNLEFDADTRNFSVPVLVAIEPERIHVVNENTNDRSGHVDQNDLLQQLVEQRGLRAQLKSGNLISGKLMVNLAFYAESPKMVLTYRENYPVVPTIPGSFERLQESMVKIIGNLEKVPFSLIGNDLRLVMEDARSMLNQANDTIGKLDQDAVPLINELQETIKLANSLIGRIDKQTFPQAEATLAELQATLTGLQKSIGVGSPLQYDIRKALQEFTKTVRGISHLVDTLDDRPQSIIFGKEVDSND